MKQNVHWIAGASLLLCIIFGVPIWLIPTAMDNVPDRSQTRVLGVYQEAANVIERTFAKHYIRDSQLVNHPGRLGAMPADTRDWIELINPMGRKAPGGGPAILPVADNTTGAIGLAGDTTAVTLTIPAYRDLASRKVTLHADSKPLQANSR